MAHIDAPMSVKGCSGIDLGGGDWHFWSLSEGPEMVCWAGLLGYGQDREGPLRVGGRLLVGHVQSADRVGRGRPTNR